MILTRVHCIGTTFLYIILSHFDNHIVSSSLLQSPSRQETMKEKELHIADFLLDCFYKFLFLYSRKLRYCIYLFVFFLPLFSTVDVVYMKKENEQKFTIGKLKFWKRVEKSGWMEKNVFYFLFSIFSRKNKC